MSVLPENIRRCMAASDRAKMGKAAMTMPEIAAKQAVKLEREMHARFEQYLRLHEIPYGHARMDRKSTYTLGWPDFSIVVRGRALFIECKLPGRELDPDQAWLCELLAREGARVVVAHSLQECIAAYLELLDETV